MITIFYVFVGVWCTLCGNFAGIRGEEHERTLEERKDFVPVPDDKIMPWENGPESLIIRTKRAEENVCPDSDTDELGRFDCFPNVDEKGCVQRGCCWKTSRYGGGPWCFYPSQYNTYRFVNMTSGQERITVYYQKQRSSGYQGDFEVAQLDIIYLSDDVIQIKIFDPLNKRFETPYPQIPPAKPLNNPKYRVDVDRTSPGFKIIRTADDVVVVNTQNVGNLLLSDKLLQISTLLPTDRVYGLGEITTSFLNNMNWRNLNFFNRNRYSSETSGSYGTHPFYLAVENDGNSHGMALLNTNALEIVLQPTPAITYRALGGIINLLVMMGPTPKDVVSQYTEFVGRPFMPPYWSLGFHLSRNFKNTETMRDVWRKNQNAAIPFDVMWNDIDYMNKFNDFTYHPVNYGGLPAFIDELHQDGMHYVVNIDAGVSAGEVPGTYPPFDRGVELDIFIKNSTNQPFLGKVWNVVSTAFPDFTHPKSSEYWLEMMTLLHKQIRYDGTWIDMNEPTDFKSGQLLNACKPEQLSYRPGWIDAAGLRHGTICMDAKHHAGSHYDCHNLHGLTQAMTTYDSLAKMRGKRPFIISRSSFVGMGRYAGHGIVGDSSWRELRDSIPAMLSFSLFGMPMAGSDICGFRGTSSEELCKRWMQLGAFYPLSRINRGAAGFQDPASFGEEAISASRRALRLRYQLLPYYYTLFWRAHVYGETVARPLFFEMPSYTPAHVIEDQFLIGPYVMVTPILRQGATFATPLFPGPEPWYNIRDGVSIQIDKRSKVNEDQTVSVRGGGIIPMQEPPVSGPVNTAVSRKMPFQLLVVPNTEGAATGELYWDDGDSLNSYEEMKYSHIEFVLENNLIESTVKSSGVSVPSLNTITVLGQTSTVTTVTINDLPCRKPQCEYQYLPETQVLRISNIDIPLSKSFTVKWTNEDSHASNAGVSKKPIQSKDSFVFEKTYELKNNDDKNAVLHLHLRTSVESEVTYVR